MRQTFININCVLKAACPKHAQKFALVLFALFYFSQLRSQDTLGSLYADQRSIQLYEEKNWDELIKLGNKALNKGYDYFYMRMRVGIAYYEKENYASAEPHFSKALEFSTNDELALEYLYYCYLFRGKNESARMLSKKFSPELLKKTSVDKQSAISFVLLEGGTKVTDSASYYDKSKKTNANYFDSPFYMQVGLNHYIKNRVSFFHAATIFNQTSFLGTLKQKQYYLKSCIPLGYNFRITPAIHLIHTNFSSTITIGPQQPPPPGMPPPQTKTETIISTDNFFTGSIMLDKTFRKFDFTFINTYSNFGDQNQFIHYANLAWSPLGNAKLILGCGGYATTNNNYSTAYFSASPFLYFQAHKKISVKLSALFNEGLNVIEDNGYLINNSPDLTKSRYSILANYNVTPNVSLYGLYQLEFKNENVQKFDYRYNVFLLGLKITPKKQK